MKKKILVWLFGLGLLAIPPCPSLIPSVAADTEEEVIETVAEDEYAFKMVLKVPQVYDNTTSQGYRKFARQVIKGKMYVVWLADGSFRLEFAELENQSFKVRGYKVRYDGFEDRNVVYTRFSWIGNNKTDIFNTPSLCFFLELYPNYAIGEATEDNSFYIMLSGAGSSAYTKSLGSRIARRFSGYAAGSQGCSCYDYGHKSPTRTASVCGPTSTPTDVVATFGSWTASWKRRNYCK